MLRNTMIETQDPDLMIRDMTELIETMTDHLTVTDEVTDHMMMVDTGGATGLTMMEEEEVIDPMRVMDPEEMTDLLKKEDEGVIEAMMEEEDMMRDTEKVPQDQTDQDMMITITNMIQESSLRETDQGRSREIREEEMIITDTGADPKIEEIMKVLDTPVRDASERREAGAETDMIEVKDFLIDMMIIAEDMIQDMINTKIIISTLENKDQDMRISMIIMDQETMMIMKMVNLFPRVMMLETCPAS